jgi:Tol biopolymer transport system component
MELKAGAGEYYISAAWKPASNKIAISLRIGDAWSGNIVNSIWLFDAFGNDPREYQENLLVTTSVTGTIEYMDWSIDGSMLAYSEGNVYSRIYVVNSDGTGNQEIILKDLYKDDELRGYAPSWAPGNKQIVFTGITGVSGTTLIPGLFVTETNGSYLVDIKTPGELPDWH